MSSSISLVTFASQTVTPQDDALIYESALGDGGIIYGGTVTLKDANTLHIAAGHGVIAGRKFTIFASDIAIPLSASGTLLGRLYIHMDLSNTATPIDILYETGNSLTTLVQDANVNIVNGVFEFNLATFNVDTSTISNLSNVYPRIQYANSGSFITVTTSDAQLIGAEVQITDGVDIIYAIFDANGVAELKNVFMTGTLTITATSGGYTGTTTLSVPYFGFYNATIALWMATLSITTTSSEFYGGTITVTDSNSQTVGTTAFSNVGTATFAVGSPDTYTLSVVYGGNTYSESVVVSAEQTYSVEINFYTIYGFHIDGAESVPSSKISYQVQYGGENVKNYSYSSAYMDYANSTFVYGDWTQTEFFMPQPVLLSQDCSTKIYLDPDNYTQDVDGNDVTSYLTGASGSYNAMMEWGRNGKKIWYKIVPDTGDTTSATVYISDTQMDNDFHAWSFYDQNDALTDHFYTSIYPASNQSNVLRSLSGKTPANNIAGTTLIGYAKANNQNSAIEWYFAQYCDWVLINLLLTMIGKSTDTQTIFGNGNCNSSAVMTTGTLNSNGLFYGYNTNTNAVKVFGMENYYGDATKWLAGYSFISGVQKYKLTYGTADGSSTSGYIEDTSAPSNYITGTSLATNLSNSGIQTMTFRSDGSYDLASGGGSTSTYYADSVWSGSGNMYARVGGSWDVGDADGTFAVNIAVALSSVGTTRGASLSCKPLSN